MSKQRKFAVFDIDGTIFRWQLYHELFDAFVDEGLIAVDVAEVVFQAREAWRNRRIDYDKYEQTLVEMMRVSVVGVEESRFNDIADLILKSKGHHVYRYTLKLLKDLKKQGYVIVAISGSYQQLVDRFAELHDIDVAVGRDHEIENGRLTEAATEIFGRKDAVLRDIVTRHDLDFADSYAVGDSGGDIAMLGIVEHPIAFNPDARLKEHAMAHGWPVVIERKSIVYELRKEGDGPYLLA